MTPDLEFRMIPLDELALCKGPQSWRDRPNSLAETLSVAAQIGERFGLRIGDCAAGVLAADALSDDDLARGIADRGRDVGTDELRGATVLYLQPYVSRVAAPMFAAWVLYGRIPDVSVANLTPRFNAFGRLQDVAMKVPRVFALPGDLMPDAEVVTVEDLSEAAIEVLLANHLLPVMKRLRPYGKLALPIAKGSVASQIGVALTFIDAQGLVPWQTVGRIALEFFGRTRAEIAGEGVSGDMHFNEIGARAGVTFRRGTCCLVYRAPSKEYCGGCPLGDRNELLETWKTRLLARPMEDLVTVAGRRQEAEQLT
ncbi:MAG: (2Fe-2S)-binding protein [Pseudomonadota bacterium]